MSHSPEPWRNDIDYVKATDDTYVVWNHPDDDCWHRCDERCKQAHIREQADAERIVACVNAIAGIPTTELEQFARTMKECKLPYASIAWCRSLLENSGYRVIEPRAESVDYA